MIRTKSQVLIILFFVLIFTCCEKVTEPESKQAEVFEIHLQFGFNNNPVHVEFDGNQVFDDTISTGSILAFAEIIPFDVRQGNHHLRAVVNTTIEAETTLVVGDSLYVAVKYNTDQKYIYFRAQTWPFPYR
jgi:hypothetical protein